MFYLFSGQHNRINVEQFHNKNYREPSVVNIGIKEENPKVYLSCNRFSVGEDENDIPFK